MSRPNRSEAFIIKAGNRFPYFKVDGESIYDFLASPKCHLLVFSDAATDVSAPIQAVKDKYADFIDVKIIPLYPSLAEMFGASETFSVFTRPDGHIGFITSENPLDAG